MLATRGEKKTNGAKPVSGIWDTTVSLELHRAASILGESQALRYTILQWSRQIFGVVGHDVCSPLLTFLDAAFRVHSGQLTLAKFSAIRM